VAQLKAGIAMKAFVVRNGKEAVIEARELVPGDIVGFTRTCEIFITHVQIITRSSWRKETQFLQMRRCDS
jgi:magnesium-transporting ATPase (P-type)